MAPKERILGLWGKPSSTIDWCEENYEVTPFIAEFWNTLSNLLMIIPPIVTIFLLVQQKLEKRFVWCHLSLLSVGVGSWCFHMTLLYSMQLLDELPMIWGSCFMVYAYFEVKSPPDSHNRTLQILLIGYSVAVTIVYLTTTDVIFHEVSYAILVALLVFRSLYILKTMECCWQLSIVAFVTYMSGFLLWNIDNHYCGKLKFLRAEVVGLLGPLSELHAWWHIGAGLGTYLSLLFIAHTRCLFLKKSPEIKFWLGFWPYLTLKTEKVS